MTPAEKIIDTLTSKRWSILVLSIVLMVAAIKLGATDTVQANLSMMLQFAVPGFVLGESYVRSKQPPEVK